MLPDLPSLPPQELTANVAQITVASKATQPKISDNCWVVLNEKSAPAFNTFNPVSFKIAKALGFYSPQLVAPDGFYQITLLQPPKHGRVTLDGGATMQSAAPQWIYQSESEDYVGLDQATFFIKAKGREFTSVVTFQVQQITPNGQEDLDALYKKLCWSKTSTSGLNSSVWADYRELYSGELSSWFRGAQFTAILSMMSGVTYSFENLPGAAVGNTTGTGTGTGTGPLPKSPWIPPHAPEF